MLLTNRPGRSGCSIYSDHHGGSDVFTCLDAAFLVKSVFVFFCDRLDIRLAGW